MPVVVLAAAASFAGYEAAGLFAAGTISSFAAGAVASTLVSAVGSKLLGLGQSAPSVNRTQTVRSAAANRRVIYGRVRAGGVLVYSSTSGSDNSSANLVVAICEGEISAIASTIWLSDEPSDLGKYAGLVTAHFFMGSATQAASADLIAEVPGDWNSTRKLSGTAYAYTKIQFDQNAFPGGLPQLSFLVDGRIVLDSRTSVIAWSENPSLCVLDYLRSGSAEWQALHPGLIGYGMRAPDRLIDFDSFNVAANICDELVTSIDPNNRVSGVSGLVKRYTLGGIIDVGASPATIVEEMQSACAGRLVFSQGKYRFYAGAFYTPQAMVLTSEFLRADPKLRMRPGRADAFNRVVGTYTEPKQDWQSTDYTPQINAVAIAADVEVTQNTNFTFTTTGAVAQRLAALALKKGLAPATLTVQCNWAPLEYRLWDVVTVNMPEINISRSMRITQYEFAEGGGIDLTLQSEDASAYAWNPATQETIVAQVVTPSFNSGAPSVLTSLAVSGAPKIADYGAVSVLSATWADASGGFFKQYEVQFRVHGAGSWGDSAIISAPLFHSLNVNYGTYYDLRARVVHVDGKASDWAEVDNTLVLNDTTAPGPPTSLSVTGSGTHTIHWTTPSDSDFAKSNVYQNTINSTTGASIITGGTVYGLPLTTYSATNTPGGTRYYFVSSVDRTGNESALTYAGTAS